MFGIGSTELVIIGLLAFLLFGPDKLPEMARTLGKGIRMFKNAQNDMQRAINLEIAQVEAKERKERRESAAAEPEPKTEAESIWDAVADEDDEEEDEE